MAKGQDREAEASMSMSCARGLRHLYGCGLTGPQDLPWTPWRGGLSFWARGDHSCSYRGRLPLTPEKDLGEGLVTHPRPTTHPRAPGTAGTLEHRPAECPPPH